MRQLTDADDCARLIEAMYGDSVDDRVGVLHVTALWQAPSSVLHTLRIGPTTPRSEHDRFALGLARARVDAILTTGKILREEPALVHRYLDEGGADGALAEWRKRTSGRGERPGSVVLTSGRDLDFGHPIFRDGTPVTVFCGQSAGDRLRTTAPSSLRVVTDSQPGPRRALAFLRREGLSVSVEAGATTTGALYEDPCAIDEVMLSVFHGDRLPDEIVGPRFEAIGRLDDGFRCVSTHEVVEPSGLWRFSRYLRG